MKRIYTEWEDIYPLTLVKLRYGGKYVAINCEEDSGHIQNVNREEVHYRLEEWMDENVSPCPYGIGTTIIECMNALMKRMNNVEDTNVYPDTMSNLDYNPGLGDSSFSGIKER